SLGPVLTSVFWVFVLVAVPFVLRRPAQWLVGPLPFYEILRTTRRGRYVLLRCLYAGALLATLYWVYASWFGDPFSETVLHPEKLPQFAEAFFQRFLAAQLGAVLLLTPALTAGAIAEEKERRSLEFLLITDLSNREIILGKTLGRLANMALLLVTGLPVLGFIQLLGGVDPDLVLLSFVFTALTMLSV